jgi:hypothetical protein
MALIRDILRLKWPGRAWSIRADDYQTLVWSQENADAKPDEATIRAFSDEVDGLLAEEQAQARRGDALYDRRDALIDALWILADAVDDIQAKLRAAALNAPLDTNADNRIDLLRTRLAQIRAMT